MGFDAGWPDLMEERHGSGCVTLGSIVIVAGGINALGEVSKSVESISLETKGIIQNEDMRKPRAYFKLILLRSTVLALGGSNVTLVEIWGGLGEPWKEAPVNLDIPRNKFSPLISTENMCE